MTDQHWFRGALCNALYKAGICEYQQYPNCKDCMSKDGPLDIITRELVKLGVSRPKVGK